MDTQQIIELVTREVLKRLNQGEEKKKSIFILDNYIEKYQELKYVLDSYNYDVTFLNQNNCKVDLSDYKHIIVPSIDNSTLVKVCIGLVDDIKSRLLSEALMKGIRPIILDEGIEYKRYLLNNKSPYIDMFREYEKRILVFGAVIIKEQDLLIELRDGTKDVYIESKIISESTIKNIFEQGQSDIRINKDAIISPLAVDYIRTNSIKIARV